MKGLQNQDAKIKGLAFEVEAINHFLREEFAA